MNDLQNYEWMEAKVDESRLKHPDDKIFLVINANAKMILPGSDEWVDAIVYAGGKEYVYVREKKEFLECFKKYERWIKKDKNKPSIF